MLIPGWNESARLQGCVDSILALRYPNKELILCAGGEDGTWELAGQFAGPGVVVLLQVAGEGKQNALQRCFEYSRGEIIFLTDADCIWDDEAFEANLEAIAEDNEAVVTGSWQPFLQQSRKALVQLQWRQHILREMTLPDYVDFVSGCNATLTREALIRAGSFLTSTPIGTDYVLARELLGAGFHIRFVRNSRVQTEYPGSVTSYVQQRSRWQRNNLLLGLRYGDWGGVLAQLRLSLTAILMLGLPFIGSHNRYCLYLWFCLFGHLYLSQIILYHRVKKWNGAHMLRLYPVELAEFLVLDWFASVRGLIEALLPACRWKW